MCELLVTRVELSRVPRLSHVIDGTFRFQPFIRIVLLHSTSTA